MPRSDARPYGPSDSDPSCRSATSRQYSTLRGSSRARSRKGMTRLPSNIAWCSRRYASYAPTERSTLVHSTKPAAPPMPARRSMPDRQQSGGDAGPLQELAEGHELVALGAGHGHGRHAHDGLAPPTDELTQGVRTRFQGPSQVHRGELQVEGVDLLPQLEGQPLPDTARVLARPQDHRRDRPRVAAVRDHEPGDPLRDRRPRLPRRGTAATAAPTRVVGARAGRDLEGRVVGDVQQARRVLGTLQVAADPEQVLGVSGEHQRVIRPAPRCPWSRRPATSSR